MGGGSLKKAKIQHMLEVKGGDLNPSSDLSVENSPIYQLSSSSSFTKRQDGFETRYEVYQRNNSDVHMLKKKTNKNFLDIRREPQ